MQKLPCKVLLCLAINIIANNRVPHMFAMNPDLMRSSCLKRKLNKVKPCVSFFDNIVCYCFSATVRHGDFLSVFLVTIKKGFYFSFTIFNDEDNVSFFKLLQKNRKEKILKIFKILNGKNTKKTK